jgi:hypothetical protein
MTDPWDGGHEIEVTGNNDADQATNGPTHIPTEWGKCKKCGEDFWRNDAEDSEGRWVHGDGGWKPMKCEGKV